MDHTEERVELRIGEVIRIGQWRVTLVDIEGDEVCLEIDEADAAEWQSPCESENRMLEIF